MQSQTITIRKLDPRVKQRLRVRAAEHGRSMEEEARVILTNALATAVVEPTHFLETARARFEAAGFVDFEVPPRDAMRPLPRFR